MNRLGPGHLHTLEAMNNLATAYTKANRLQEAASLLRQALDTMEQADLLKHPDALKMMNNLSIVYQKLGRDDEALSMAEQSYQMRRAVQGDDHPDTLRAMNNLAAEYWRRQRYDLSIPMYEEALAMGQAALGVEHRETIRAAFNLAVNYRDSGRTVDALRVFDEWLPRANASLSPPDDVLSFGWQAAEETYTAAKMHDKAEPVLRQLTSLERETSGPESTNYADVSALLGWNLIAQGKHLEAEMPLRECLRVRELLEPEEWTTFLTQSLLGECLVGQKRFTEAEPLLLSGYAEMKNRETSIPPEGRPALKDAIERIIGLYEAWDRKQAADEWREKLSSP
jgi:tetratricopeptide (TPR) repeat protein